jgi:sec-independent protein translocase protein TatA
VGIENPVHLIFIAAIALIFLGPKRLPELAKALGHGIREFRDAVNASGEPQHGVPATPVAPEAEAAPAVAPVDPGPVEEDRQPTPG